MAARDSVQPGNRCNPGYAQAIGQPAPGALDQIVAFEQGIFSTLASRFLSGSLSTNGEGGGPVPLAAPYTPDISAIAFSLPSPPMFNLFDSLASSTGSTVAALQQQPIYHDQQIFNTRPFAVSYVAGFHNVPGLGTPGTADDPTLNGNPVEVATCAPCHNASNNGTDAAPQAQHGVGGDSVAVRRRRTCRCSSWCAPIRSRRCTSAPRSTPTIRARR